MNTMNSYKLALVDDDFEFAERMVDYYSARKMVVTHFEKPESLLSELRGATAGHSPYDLVLTDLMMPDMNGIEFTQKIKIIFPELPVIVMTGNSSVDMAIQAIESGATDYIVKPPHFPHLTVVLQRTLHFAHIQKENAQLKKTIESSIGSSSGIIAKSSLVLRAIELAKRVAPSEATVLITGDSGTGKEIFAQLIHKSSRRAGNSFVAINCSAIPENLLESELFGHARGAFTGADAARAGLFEEANGGTIFLDEIGDMSLHLQSKLLRVLQDRKIKRVGENVYRDIDVRIIAATLRNLVDDVRTKRFREDLFYRLNVIPMRLPSLRERKEDILPLSKHFLERFSSRYEKNIRSFTREAAEWLLSQSWKGNVRELENAIERAVVVADSDLIQLKDLQFESLNSIEIESPAPTTEAEKIDAETVSQVETDELLKDLDTPPPSIDTSDSDSAVTSFGAYASPNARLSLTSISDSPLTLAELEMRYIHEVLEKCDGVKDRAARILGIDRKTLYRKIQAEIHAHESGATT